MLNPGESSNHRSQFEREDLVPTLVVHFTTDKPWLIDMHTQGTPANEHLKGVLAQCGFVRVIWGPDVLTEKIGQSEQYTQIVVVMLDKAQDTAVKLVEQMRAEGQCTYTNPCYQSHVDAAIHAADGEIKGTLMQLRDAVQWIVCGTQNDSTWNLNHVPLNLFAVKYPVHIEKKKNGECVLLTLIGDALHGAPWFRSSSQAVESAAIVAHAAAGEPGRSKFELAHELEENLRRFVTLRAAEAMKYHSDLLSRAA